jgi:sulfoxide reductase catalytic subunit YedY
MNVKSVIGYPTNNTVVAHNSHVVVRGVAFDDGHGIRDVLISTDGGKSWKTAILKDADRYAFREFRFAYKPTTYGKVTIMAKAINRLGAEQPFAHEVKWNHGGYKYNGIDSVTIEVI